MQKNNYYLEQINEKNEKLKEAEISLAFIQGQIEKEKNEIINNYIRYGSHLNLEEIPEEHFNEYSFLGSIFINGFSDCDINNKTLQLFSQTFLECQNYPDDIIVEIFLLHEINGYKVNFNSISELYLSFINTYLKTNLSKEKLFEFLFFHNGEDYLFNLFKLEDLLLDFGISIYNSSDDKIDLIFDFYGTENFYLQPNFDINRLTDTVFNYLIPNKKNIITLDLNQNRKLKINSNLDKNEIYNILSNIKEELLEIPF
tara:strand:- start:14826 stop:15596 length:771 start_codon:yes stop_codon:yes gene_type:complete